MKNKKSFALLTTGLVGLLALSACAPTKITPEEGKAILSNMQRAYQANEITPTKQIHVNATHKIAGKMPAGKASVDLGYDIQVDLDNLKAKMSYQTLGKDVMSTWAYYQEGNFITAFESGEVKKYTTIPVNEEEAKELFEDFKAVKEEIKQTGEEALENLEVSIEGFENFDAHTATTMFGGKTKASLDAEFRSDNPTQLHFYVSANLDNAFITELATTVNVKASVKFKVENYLLSSLENQVTYNGKVLGQEVEYSRISTMHVDNKAKIKLPNIEEFTRANFDIPELPFDLD